MHDIQMDGNYICHYTSLNALESLIKAYQESNDKSSIILRATDVYSTNDKLEMSFGYEYVLELFSELEKELPKEFSDNKYRISRYMEDVIHSKKYKNFTERQFVDWMLKSDSSTFVISLSRHKDNIDMWQKYGKNGYGVCLVFDKKALSQIQRPSGLFVQGPLNVIYGNRAGFQNMHILFNYIGRKEYDDYIEQAQHINDIDNIVELKLKSLDQLCGLCSVFIKDEKWHNEREVRIAITRNYFPNENKPIVKIDEKNRKYIELLIPFSCLKEIIIGSCVKENVIYDILSELGDDNSFIKIVSRSNTPLQ